MIIQKQLLLCCFFLLCSLYAAIAQRKIALEHSGASSFFTDIPTAIDAAVSGDIIYLPGGSFPGFDIFNKQLTIIGVGHNLDSTAATTMTLISGNIVMVGVDCSGSVFTGLRATNIISNETGIDNIQVSRCFINQSVYGSNSNNWTISECFIGSISNVVNSLVSNNLIAEQINSANNSQIENNIFLYASFPMNTNNSCVINNNIFKSFAIFIGNISNSLFNNNIYSSGNLPNGLFGNGNIGLGNINDTDFDGLFTNFSYSVYNESIGNLYQFDFHIVNPAYNAGGTNNTAIGIYGGGFPWKAGSVPFNPHINLKIIPSTTNNSGNLPVQIRVRAQEN